MEPNTRSASSVASFDRVNSTTPRWRKRLSRSSRRSERSQSTSELRWSPSTRITRLFSTSKPCGTTTPSSPDGGLNFNSIQLPSTTAPGKTISFPTSSVGRHQFDASSRSFSVSFFRLAMPKSFDLSAAHRFRRTPRVLSGGPEDCYVAPVPHLELGLRSRLVFDSDQPCLRFRPAQSTLRLLVLAVKPLN